jgi:deoxycytidylate deaminase
MLQDYASIENGNLRLYFHDGYRDIQLSQNAGKIVWRYKNGFIQHTGIELGQCPQTREQFYIHNHPDEGRASIVSASDFRQGKEIYYENEPCVNTPNEVISMGLNAVIQQVPYRVMSSNCQNLTNGACKNVSYSQDKNKVLGGIAALGLGFLTLWGIDAAFKK